MFNLKIFLPLVFLSVCDGYRFLCLLPYPGKSHHMVFEPLLQELANRGHQLTVVSFFPSAQPHPNRRDVSLEGLAALNVEVLDLKDFDYSYFGLERYFEHVPLVTQLAKSNLQLCEKLLDSKVFEEFVNREGEYDVILVEHFNSDCMLGLIHNYGLPSVGLMSCAVLPWTPSRVGAPDNPSYVPGMTLPLTDEMTFAERIENAFFLYFYIIWYDMVIRKEEQRLLERKLGRELPPLEDVAKNASVVLVNAHHSLNGVKVFPPSIVEVGGLHLHNRTVQPLPSDLNSWVSDAEHGFILISFGSLIRGSSLPVKRLQAILKVFARLPQRVIWKWETKDIDNLPPNVRIEKWLPQYDLLRHNNCVAFITHAGMLSMTEAVAAGVPVLAVPVLGDQFGNAAHASKAGIAVVLSLRDLDEHRLSGALERLLSKEMRDAAKRLSATWWDRPQSPMDTAVHYVEMTARHKGLNMSSHARFLTRTQLALLDIFAFVMAMIMLSWGLFRWVCKRRVKEKQL